MDPWSHLMCTPPRRGHPFWFPLSLMTGGYGPHPQRLIRTPVQGDYPRYHSIMSPPRRALSPGSLTPRVERFPATRSCPLPFVYFLCDPLLRASMQNHCQLEEFIKTTLKCPKSWCQRWQPRLVYHAMHKMQIALRSISDIVLTTEKKWLPLTTCDHPCSRLYKTDIQ